MAYFAKIGMNNEVIDLVVVNNINCMTPHGDFEEDVGTAFLQRLTGHQVWVRSDANGAIRTRCAVVGGSFSSEHDAFLPPWPGEGWALNPETLLWEELP